MKQHYELILNTLPFPDEARVFLREAGTRVLCRYDVAVEAAIHAYISGEQELEPAAARLHTLASELGLPIRTMDLIFVACGSRWLRATYAEEGLSDELFWDTMADIACKAVESHTVYNEWGLDCILWYDIFFKRDLFWLGRLQYERFKSPMETPVTVGGYTIQPGETVYNIHIPSGAPLTRESRMDSYRRAYEFFAAERGDKPLFGCCLSWLLFPANREIFPPHLNMIDFMNDFKIVDEQPNDFHDLWRVFGVPFTGDMAALPRDNTMRRALGAWLDEGNETGYGVGYFVFDGENLLTN